MSNWARYADSYPVIDVAVITNGQYWDIYYYDDVEGEVIPEFIDENGRERPLGIHWHDTRATASRLHHHLWKGHYWQ